MSSGTTQLNLRFEVSTFDFFVFWFPGRKWITRRALENELDTLVKSLKSNGSLEVAKRVKVNRLPLIGVTASPDFVLLSKDVIVDLAKVTLPPLFTFLAGWLARSSRKVHIKVGDIEAEAENVDQLKRVLSMVEGLRNPRATDETPVKHSNGESNDAQI